MEIITVNKLIQKIAEIICFCKTSQLPIRVFANVDQTCHMMICKYLEELLSRLLCETDCINFHSRALTFLIVVIFIERNLFFALIIFS